MLLRAKSSVTKSYRSTKFFKVSFHEYFLATVSSSQHRLMILPLFAFIQDYKPAVYTVSFPHHVSLTYGESKAATVKNKTGTHKLDLSGFLDKRIASWVPGNPDKSANQLLYTRDRGVIGVYLNQAIAISPERALGVIGYSNGSSIPTDTVHDLVFISVKGEPSIEFIRSIELPGDLGNSVKKPRLFWSQKQLILRQFKGFDILDSNGIKTADLPNTVRGEFVGLNRVRELVFSKGFRQVGLVIFNADSRKYRVYDVAPPEGKINWTLCFFHDSSKVEISVSLSINIKTEGVNRSMRYFMNPNTGKLIGKGEYSDGGGPWIKLK